nr:MAG TPA: hypothetical protein [Caudoviricetes sp.]
MKGGDGGESPVSLVSGLKPNCQYSKYNTV